MRVRWRPCVWSHSSVIEHPPLRYHQGFQYTRHKEPADFAQLFGESNSKLTLHRDLGHTRGDWIHLPTGGLMQVELAFCLPEYTRPIAARRRSEANTRHHLCMLFSYLNVRFRHSVSRSRLCDLTKRGLSHEHLA
jgi:hypothetical protein